MDSRLKEADYYIRCSETFHSTWNFIQQDDNDKPYYGVIDTCGAKRNDELNYEYYQFALIVKQGVFLILHMKLFVLTNYVKIDQFNQTKNKMGPR